MKRTWASAAIFVVLVAAMSLLAFSCETVGALLGGASLPVFGTPSFSLEAVALKGLDLQGITFTCDYAIDNPYPVGISIKRVAADVLCGDKQFTTLSADDGVTIESRGRRRNTLEFKVPYNAILDFASAFSEKKDALPFSVKGTAALDLSSVAQYGLSDISLPFSKSFDVPIFKPEFSVSNAQVVLPSTTELIAALVKGGVSALRAKDLTSSLAAGKGIPASVLESIDINVDVLCNLNVKNSGSSAWDFLLKDCSLQNSDGKTLANIMPEKGNSISGLTGALPLKTSINTLKAGAFIAQLINKTGKNPVLKFDSGLSFPSLPHMKNIPLSGSYEIPLSSVTVKQ